MMADEYILKRNALAILMGDKVDLSPNFVPVSMAIDPSSIAKFKDINFTCDRHIDLIKAIPAEDVAPAKKWIPVSEKLPDKNMWCLVICNEWGGRITRISTFLADYFGERFEEDGKVITRFVTHWMPLPEPPKEGK